MTNNVNTQNEMFLFQVEEQVKQLQSALPARELELATLEAEMLTFESRYNDLVGYEKNGYYGLTLKLAELLEAVTEPDSKNDDTIQMVREREEKSRESYLQGPHISDRKQFNPDNAAKFLFIDVTQQIYNGLFDEEEFTSRKQSLPLLYQAYAEGDLDTIRGLLSNLSQPPSHPAQGSASLDRVKLLRKLAQLEERASYLSKRLQELKETELYQLMKKAEEASQTGHDLIQEQADEYANLSLHLFRNLSILLYMNSPKQRIRNIPKKDELVHMYHHLWTTAVGQEGYNKSDWTRFGDILSELGLI